MCDECKCHEHGVGLFSRTHSNLYGEWENLSIRVPDDNNTISKREAYAAEPTLEHLLSLGGALFFQLRYKDALVIYEECVKKGINTPSYYLARRKRAITYLKLLKNEEAYQEFLWCLDHTSKEEEILDVTYRLGLCQYYLGEYAKAKDYFKDCFALALNNPDMYVSSLYWFKLCLIKLNDNDNTEFIKYRKQYKNNFYTHPGYDLFIRFVCGEIDLDEFEYQVDSLSQLQQTCSFYGMSVYFKEINERYSRRYLKLTVSLEDYFGGFAYIAAYLDRKNNQ